MLHLFSIQMNYYIPLNPSWISFVDKCLSLAIFCQDSMKVLTVAAGLVATQCLQWIYISSKNIMQYFA